MKEKFTKIIGVLLIFIGVYLLYGTISDKIETKKKQEALIEIFENNNVHVEAEDTDENIDNKFETIAILEIPSISFTQAVVEGVSNEAIQYYVGHFENTAKPGEKGNFAVAAHNVSSYSDAFKNLHKLKNNDQVILKTQTNEFIYEVTDNFIVTPDKVEILDATDDATITLVTCTNDGKQRVVVKGNLVKNTAL